MIHLSKDKWLFAGVFSVDGVSFQKDAKKSWYQYTTTEISGLEHLTGHAIISFNRTLRASYLRGKRFGDMLKVSEIRGERMTVGDFPGYNSVLISHRLLKTIVTKENPSWKTALSNVSGVYIIVDTKTGKTYVGSANGGLGIWQRWSSYVFNGHGNNKELKDVIKTKGSAYVNNFQYSILEVEDINSSADYIINRENHWKQVLCSRGFGYNQN